MELRFISAGAAQGLVHTLAAANGVQPSGDFGAVGAMIEKFLAGESCDVVILARAQIERLEREGRTVPGSSRDLGGVPTSIAVLEGHARPNVSSADRLRETLEAADAIYFPDPAKATAGIHFAKVLEQLGLTQRVAARLRTFPNGSTAMREMSKVSGKPVGCTQSTEILATPGVRLVAPLPAGLDLVTVYTAAVNARSSRKEDARGFVELLGGDDTRAQRNKAGFA